MPLTAPQQARNASGASLGAMLILLDLRPETLADSCGDHQMRTAIERCLGCPTHAACARWIADQDRRPGSWRAFCPNAAMLAKTQPIARRGR